MIKNKYTKKKLFGYSAIFLLGAILLFSIASFNWIYIVGFNKSMWKEDIKNRESIAYYLVDQKILIGKTRQEIKNILGDCNIQTSAKQLNLPKANYYEPMSLNINNENFLSKENLEISSCENNNHLVYMVGYGITDPIVMEIIFDSNDTVIKVKIFET